ncbi:Ig-like domain-containing protein [Sneathiella aquimaris]|uniref:Ig-like domain-containing protein n=1 Tax=Sneathiella aquimaris TaxID=2599305 RepID=UPI00146ED2A8|nr:Ig-like domain-containing protein [Sneathiella aquimaris]
MAKTENGAVTGSSSGTLVVVEAGQNVLLDIANADLVVFSQEGSNLVVTSIADGASIVLEGFFSQAGTDLPPQLTLSDGSVLTAADVTGLVEEFNPDLVAPAAGGPGAGGGTGGGASFGAYGDDGIGDGIGIAGLLDPTELGFGGDDVIEEFVSILPGQPDLLLNEIGLGAIRFGFLREKPNDESEIPTLQKSVYDDIEPEGDLELTGKLLALGNPEIDDFIDFAGRSKVDFIELRNASDAPLSTAGNGGVNSPDGVTSVSIIGPNGDPVTFDLPVIEVPANGKLVIMQASFEGDDEEDEGAVQTVYVVFDADGDPVSGGTVSDGGEAWPVGSDTSSGLGVLLSWAVNGDVVELDTFLANGYRFEPESLNAGWLANPEVGGDPVELDIFGDNGTFNGKILLQEVVAPGIFDAYAPISAEQLVECSPIAETFFLDIAGNNIFARVDNADTDTAEDWTTGQTHSIGENNDVSDPNPQDPYNDDMNPGQAEGPEAAPGEETDNNGQNVIIVGVNDDDFTDGESDVVNGGRGQDFLFGDENNNDLSGGEHNDYLDGGAGNDMLMGDSGGDVIIDDQGQDVMVGGTGSDVIFGRRDSEDDTLDGGSGNDIGKPIPLGKVLLGAEAGDEIGNENPFGYNEYGTGDLLIGDDIISGGWGNDFGKKGGPEQNGDFGPRALLVEDDILVGGFGNDQFGDPQQYMRDIMVAGDGNDIIYGDNAGLSFYGNASEEFTPEDINSFYYAILSSLGYGASAEDFAEVYRDAVQWNYGGADLIYGGWGADLIFGQGGDDAILAGHGNDTVAGGSGADKIRGNGGYDFLLGDTGNDTIYGDAGSDVIHGQEDDDLLYGGDGNDEMTGGIGNDLMYGGAGNDEMDGNDGQDVMYGDDGRDDMHGGNGNDIMYGGAGNDHIGGGSGNDIMHGGDANDDMHGDQGDDLMYGGAGNDEMDGNDGQDVMYGDDGRDEMHGGNGNDIMYGGAGNDHIGGGSGNDIMHGGDASDDMHGDQGDDLMYGGAGNDEMVGNDGQDAMFGDDGQDDMHGGDGNDSMFGDAGNDRMYGGTGNDTLYGGADNDVMDGGQDDDLMYGEAGDDVMLGAGGDDTLYGGSGSFDVLYGGDNNDLLYGDDGADALIGDDDILFGGAGGDTLFGNGGGDSLHGDAGDDFLAGQTGSDLLEGGAGNDTLEGNVGDDTLDGGLNDDLLRWTAGEEDGGSTDAYSGGSGTDTLELYLTQAEFDAHEAAIAEFANRVENGESDTLVINGRALTAEQVEHVAVHVDGLEIPVLIDDSFVTDEDTDITARVTADLATPGQDFIPNAGGTVFDMPDQVTVAVPNVTTTWFVINWVDNGSSVWSMSLEAFGNDYGDLIFDASDPENVTVTLDIPAGGSSFDDLIDGQSGTVTFDYGAHKEGSETATITITVNGKDEPIVAADDIVITNSEAPIDIPEYGMLANDVDPEGDALSVGSVDSPATSAGGYSTVTPSGDPNADVVFGYEASDGNDGDSADVTVEYQGFDQGIGKPVLHSGFLQGDDRSEIAIGSDGADTIVGGGGDDTIAGGGGNDVIEGGAGADVVHFYDVDDGDDILLDFDVNEDVVNLDALFDELGIAGAENRADLVILDENAGSTTITVSGESDFSITLYNVDLGDHNGDVSASDLLTAKGINVGDES